MQRLAERLIEQFQSWEIFGRGDLPLCDDPISPEPPYQPFGGYRAWGADRVDDGRKPSPFERFVGVGKTEESEPNIEEEESPEIDFRLAEEVPRVEIKVHFPKDYRPDDREFEAFLMSISSCAHPLSFEVMGTATSIEIQWSVAEPDVPLVQRQAETWFPEAFFSIRENALAEALLDERTPSVAVAECRLANICHFPIQSGRGELQSGVLGALSDLRTGELGLMQVFFEPVTHGWSRDLLNTVLADGEPFFAGGSDLVRATQRKVAKPLFGVVVRFTVTAKDSERLEMLFRNLTAPLSLSSAQGENEVESFFDEENLSYPDLLSIAKRTTRRFGMLLNLDELMQFVRFPATAHLPQLVDGEIRSRPAPSQTVKNSSLELGTVVHRGEEQIVSLTTEQRVRHTHIIGASGTGKSTLLLNCIRQDMENGQGIAVIDPHGDLIDLVLRVVPRHRINDVILFDPSDDEFPVGFNVLDAHSSLEKTLLASDLCSIFRRFSTSWGDQMTAVLSNAILALLESSRGGTLADLRKFLVDKSFRQEFLKTVEDSEVVYFWNHDYKLLSRRPEGSIVTRLNSFLRPKPIRHMVSQRHNKVDFSRMMDDGKILLARIPQGLIGEENAFLLGSLLVTKIHQLVLGRQSLESAKRRPFFLYCDEFHNFITSSMSSILSGARKYNLGLTLVHQNMRQLEGRDQDVASSVLANAHNRIVFRAGDHDAKALEGGFNHYSRDDLQSLKTGQAIGRIGSAESDFCLSVPWLDTPNDEQTQETALAIIDHSRSTYGVPVSEVESKPLPQKPDDHIEELSNSPKLVSDSLSETASHPEPKSGPEKKLPKLQPERIKDPAQASPGRGGKEHKALQKLVKQLAHAFDYRASVEKTLPDGRSIDVLLERGDELIAVEISITTPLEFEIKNIAKCLELEVSHVVWLSPDEKKRRKMKKLVASEFSKAKRTSIHVMEPDEFQGFLEKLSRTQVKTETSKGYAVNVSFVTGDAVDRSEHRKKVGKALADAEDRLRNR